jgi:beta-lactamase regulating signal transducer with metallopeptidase domain
VLWGLVGIRLIWPFSFESRLSLIPSAETISPDLLYSQTPVIQSGISRINQIVNPVLTESLAPAAGASVNPLQVISGIAAVVWLAGLLVLLSYAGISYLRLRRRVRPSIRLYDRLWLCDQLSPPSSSAC